MGVLNREEIKDRIARSDYDNKLVITPLLSENQIGPASVDIRLGSAIIFPKKTFVDRHDVTQPDQARQAERRIYEKVRLKYHDRFILHPNELILAATFEYVCLPSDVFCLVATRSSWGLLGLVIATASVVQPGYKGCLTLELANLSDSPIALYPGLLVGQLVLMDVEGKTKEAIYQGRYDCPTEPEMPRFYTQEVDEEMQFWSSEP